VAGRAGRRLAGALSAAGVALLVGALGQADAASFQVTNTNASGAGSLAQAVTDANNAGGADTITFAPGVTGTIDAGVLTITGPTTIAGPGAASLTVSTRLSIDTTATAAISELTIDGGTMSGGNAAPGDGTGSPGVPTGTGGSATGGNAFGGNADGGAVDNEGELVLDRVVVTGGKGTAGSASGATGQGGAGGNGNTAFGTGGPGGSGTSGSGAAGDVRGVGVFNGGSMTLRDSTVTGNSGVAGDGGDANALGGAGGVGGSAGGGNGAGGAGGAGASTGANGGDVRGVGVYNAGTMTIEGSTITGNSAGGGSGGDAHATGGSGGPFVGAFPGGAGGSATATGGAGGDALGAGVFNAGTLELRNSTISGNSATASGTAGTATQTNGTTTTAPGGQATATAGRAGISGGSGLQNETSGSASATLRSVTIATNRADLGANLRSTGTLTISNSIVANPNAGPNCDGAITSGGFNIDSGTSCGFAQAGDLSATDPQLGLLQDNGGPTATHAPAQTSPAIDHGSAGGLTTDQRGFARPSDFSGIPNASGGDGADIGAVELVAPSVEPPPAELTVEVTARGKQKGTKLRATITCSKDCDLNARAKGKAGGDKFKTKPTSVSLPAGVATNVKLKLKKGDRRDVAGEKGKATIAVTATAGGESATDSSKVKLKP
jgi:fibronectin-binding autotransporter adhesin